MSCHQNKNETRCQKTTTAKVQSRATAKATPMGPTKVDFDLELDVRPKCCRIRRRRQDCHDPCRPPKCVFTVEVELDVNAHISPLVQNNCFPVRLDVETHHQVQCENSQYEPPHYPECHPHLRKNCRCGNPSHHRR